MTREITISKIKEYFEFEYKATKRVIESSLSDDDNYKWIRTDTDRRHAVSQAIDRFLGVAFFVQYCDIPYNVIDPLYNEYKDKLESIRVSAN